MLDSSMERESEMNLVERLREACIDWGVANEAADEIATLRKELEIERLRLAACGVAALGYFEGCCDEYKSASLDDVLRMREELEAARKDAESKQAKIDRLMLEYCPDEMTPAQVKEWELNQKPFTGCPNCGSTAIHACLGFKPEPWTEEQKRGLRNAIESMLRKQQP